MDEHELDQLYRSIDDRDNRERLLIADRKAQRKAYNAKRRANRNTISPQPVLWQRGTATATVVDNRSRVVREREFALRVLRESES